MSAGDEVRAAVRSLSAALTRCEQSYKSIDLSEYRSAREDLISAARCVVLAQSSVEVEEAMAESDGAEKAREAAADWAADAAMELERADGES